MFNNFFLVWTIPVLTVATGLLGVFLTVRHFKIVRTISYIERMNDPSMVNVRARVDEWLFQKVSDAEKLAALEADRRLHASVKLFYNLLTELAIAFKYGTIDAQMVYDIYDPLVPKYWTAMKFYIDYSRATGWDIGHELEKFAATFPVHK